MNKTKCIVLGEQPTEVKKKPIEFVKCLGNALSIGNPITIPSDYKNLELICRAYSSLGDLIFAYDNDRHCGILYLGHWNDGVAE